MAVLSSPVPAVEKVKKNETEEMKPISDTQKKEIVEKQPKRSKDPGIRVIGARIYDSQNGKTCHQCRQKTMDFTAGCKNMKGNKQCTIKFCHKCLLNRYGEKAEEMEALENWNCPRCRDICNCSFCMKKKGLKPTGILVHAAKATGFSSVSELLHVKGPDVSEELIANSKAASLNESAVLTEGPAVVSPKKQGKENSVDGSCKAELKSRSLPASPNDKVAKKAKRERKKGFKERAEAVCIPPEDTIDITLGGSPRKVNITQEYIMKEVLDDDKDKIRRSPRKNNAPQEATKEEKVSDDNLAKETKKVKKIKAQVEPKVKSRKLQKEKDIIDEIVEDVVLPSGCMMTNVAGIDLLPDDVGHALQFLEFCSTFGEVLRIQKGHPESVLRDIFNGRTMRRGKFSSTVQFLIQIVSFILKDMPEEEEEEEEKEKEKEKESPRSSPSNDKDSWIRSLKRCLAESELELEDFPEDCFDKGVDGYEMLDPSQKLRLLTFLCDESLSVKEMRTWIEEQNLKFVEKEKEEKESLNAAKKKEKEEAKRKLQEKVAALVIAQTGVPLTISEHDTVISKIKAETECARKELLEAMDVMPKKRKQPPAVRTDSVFMDESGHAFWRLASLDDSNLLLQEVGVPEQINYKDKWFSFNAEEMQVVEKYISSVRLKKYKRTKLADQKKMKSNSDVDADSSSNDDVPPAIDDNLYAS